MKNHKCKGLVVILEDKPDKELEELENVLRQENYEVFTYINPREFLEDIKLGLNYEVAVIDLEFGDNCEYDGEDIVSSLRKKNPRKPIVTRSAYASEYYRPRDSNSMILKRRDPVGRALDKIEGAIKDQEEYNKSKEIY